MTRRARHQLRCQCCDLLFPAMNRNAKFCSNACRQYDFHQRRRLQPVIAQTELIDDNLPPAWRTAAPEPTPAAALAPFAYDGHQVRVITDAQGEPWFVAADVCRCLAIANSRDALTRLDDDEKGVGSTDTPGGTQSVTTVNEFGLYSLILGSRKPEARAFKRWVTHEVLPAIRKTGRYEAAPAPAAQPQQLPISEGVYVFASTRRRAAEIWWAAIHREVTGTLAARFNPTHRTDAGLPRNVAYTWQPSLL